MTPLQMHPSDRFAAPGIGQPKRPWQALPLSDRAPPPKPLVMGNRLSQAASDTVHTHWQPGSLPMFPIEPANDPVGQLDENERTSMRLLTLVTCATMTVAALGYGLQVLQ